MKIIAISDLHGEVISPEKLPDGDVLVVAGDVLPDDYIPNAPSATVGTSRAVRQGYYFDEVFLPWLTVVKKKYRAVLWIGGNHDFFLQMIMGGSIKRSMPEGVHYLLEETVEIEGVTFFGAPWNGTRGWAFALDEEDHYRRLQDVPPGIDVFICHGPPYSSGFEGELEYYTSPALSNYIREHKPKVFICGHVHEAYGKYRMWETDVYVVSSKDRNYKLVNPPVEIEI